MLNRTCDFCYKRKRPCDGLAQRRCSFCIAKNQAECHYRRRLSRSRTSASTSRHPRHDDDEDGDEDGDDATTGRSFWRTDSDAVAANFSARGGVSAAVTSGADGGREPGRLLPLKRCRFSASPATGLVGLQENIFLGDFFACLGFLTLANQSTVRDAVVRIMLAGGSPHNPQHHHHRSSGGTPSQFQPLPWHEQGLVGEDDDEISESDCGETGAANVAEGCRSDALAAESVTREYSSTCILWCAVALGALVRGHPSAVAERYAGLAEDSLRACRDDTTLETARAYVAMAFLHNFLNGGVRSHEYVKLANGIVDELPLETIPRGFHGLLHYADMAWTLEPELASEEDIKAYWENAAPIWELSENVVEQDISGLVLSVSVRISQPFADATGVSRVFFAGEPQPRQSAAKPMVCRPLIEQAEQQGAQSAVRDSSGVPSEEVAALEEDQICLDNVVASADMHRSVLPEMLRVQEWFESSNMHQGVGGLLYYGTLSYLQVLNNEDANAMPSFFRGVDVMLRYPGLCRYSTWLRMAHSQLYILVLTQMRSAYEELRASHNSVLPPGSKPAPPFEDCRSMSDICDHAKCRRSAARMKSMVIPDWITSKQPAP